MPADVGSGLLGAEAHKAGIIVEEPYSCLWCPTFDLRKHLNL